MLALHYFRSSAWKGTALREIKETDWKVLRYLHPLAVERFCEGALAEVERVMHNNTESAHQRYLDIFRIMERRDREMARLFNGLKRSQGLMMLALIRSAGLLTKDEFSSLSEMGLRPAKSYENRSELIYAAARSGEVEESVDTLRPPVCLIRSMRVTRIIERHCVSLLGERR